MCLVGPHAGSVDAVHGAQRDPRRRGKGTAGWDESAAAKHMSLTRTFMAGDLRQSRRELINRINRLCDQLEALKQNAA